jgi:hypothetical protein
MPPRTFRPRAAALAVSAALTSIAGFGTIPSVAGADECDPEVYNGDVPGLLVAAGGSAWRSEADFLGRTSDDTFEQGHATVLRLDGTGTHRTTIPGDVVMNLALAPGGAGVQAAWYSQEAGPGAGGFRTASLDATGVLGGVTGLAPPVVQKNAVGLVLSADPTGGWLATSDDEAPFAQRIAADGTGGVRSAVPSVTSLTGAVAGDGSAWLAYKTAGNTLSIARWAPGAPGPDPAQVVPGVSTGFSPLLVGADATGAWVLSTNGGSGLALVRLTPGAAPVVQRWSAPSRRDMQLVVGAGRAYVAYVAKPPFGGLEVMLRVTRANGTIGATRFLKVVHTRDRLTDLDVRPGTSDAWLTISVNSDVTVLRSRLAGLKTGVFALGRTGLRDSRGQLAFTSPGRAILLWRAARPDPNEVCRGERAPHEYWRTLGADGHGTRVHRVGLGFGGLPRYPGP